MFPNVVDVQALRAEAAGEPAPAYNAAGSALVKTTRNEGRPLIVMCGPFSHEKGADIFLDMAQRLSGHDFLWVGAAVPARDAITDILSRYRQLGLSNFYLTGAINSPVRWFGRANLMAFTSRSDSMPTVVLEALSVDLPVYAFPEVLGVPELVLKFATPLKGKPSATALIHALSAHFESARVKPELSAAHFVDLYDQSSTFPRLQAFLMQVLSPRIS